MRWVAPRSIRSHWVPGPSALAQRVSRRPSSALAAVKSARLHRRGDRRSALRQQHVVGRLRGHRDHQRNTQHRRHAGTQRERPSRRSSLPKLGRQHLPASAVPGNQHDRQDDGGHHEQAAQAAEDRKEAEAAAPAVPGGLDHRGSDAVARCPACTGTTSVSTAPVTSATTRDHHFTPADMRPIVAYPASARVPAGRDRRRTDRSVHGRRPGKTGRGVRRCDVVRGLAPATPGGLRRIRHRGAGAAGRRRVHARRGGPSGKPRPARHHRGAAGRQRGRWPTRGRSFWRTVRPGR